MDTVRKAGNTEYILRRNRGQKNLRLHIGSSGEVIVSAPYFASFSEIDGFVIRVNEKNPIDFEITRELILQETVL